MKVIVCDYCYIIKIKKVDEGMVKGTIIQKMGKVVGDPKSYINFDYKAGSSLDFRALYEEHDCNPKVGSRNESAMHAAVRNDREDILRIILDTRGVDINIVNRNGTSVLDTALSFKKLKIAALLLSKGEKLGKLVFVNEDIVQNFFNAIHQADENEERRMLDLVDKLLLYGNLRNEFLRDEMMNSLAYQEFHLAFRISSYFFEEGKVLLFSENPQDRSIFNYAIDSLFEELGTVRGREATKILSYMLLNSPSHAFEYKKSKDFNAKLETKDIEIFREALATEIASGNVNKAVELVKELWKNPEFSQKLDILGILEVGCQNFWPQVIEKLEAQIICSHGDLAELLYNRKNFLALLDANTRYLSSNETQHFCLDLCDDIFVTMPFEIIYGANKFYKVGDVVFNMWEMQEICTYQYGLNGVIKSYDLREPFPEPRENRCSSVEVENRVVPYVQQVICSEEQRGSGNYIQQG